jgi:diguanylate cyclase (GGDEF)-like protein
MGTALCIANLAAGLESLAGLLTRAGHVVEVVADADKGLAVVLQRRFDLVLCEVSGTIDGYRVLSEIRALPPSLSVLPVVLVVDDESSRSDGVGRGADDVVPRSVGAAGLAAIAMARMRRSVELRNAFQQCNPTECPGRFHAEMSVFNDVEPIAGLLSLAQLDGLASCATLWKVERPPVVMVVAIDRFAAIAATLGQAYGEELLRVVAQRLASFDQKLGLLAHVGADTFAALLPPKTALDDAKQLADTVRRAMLEPFSLSGRTLSATVSIGLARGERPVGLAILLARATAAAQHANSLGGNLVFTFLPEEIAREAERLSIASALRAALDNNEFRMVFQPKLRMSDGVVVGAEALMRWNSATLGVVPPALFIPIAEEYGLIAELGDFALRCGAETLREWHRQDWGIGLSMAVNVSAYQLRRHGFAAEVAAIVAATGVPAACLTLEITESAFVGNEREVAEAIVALKDLGCRLSMDDFGTGYSSLSYLHRIPLDEIKIDQSFVAGLPTIGISCGIVEAIIAIARRLDLHVVAEGIETEGQAAFLKAHGVAVAQGMMLAPPMCDAEFRTLCGQSAAPVVAAPVVALRVAE